MKVEKGKKIKIEYSLTVDGDKVLESSDSRGPLEYVQGDGRMLPGFEARIDGMEVGDEREGTIPAAEAVGTDDSLTSVLPRTDFPEDEDIEVGKQYEANSAEGPVSFKVLEVDADKVTVRFVHPLAGKDIQFKVKVLDISE